MWLVNKPAGMVSRRVTDRLHAALRPLLAGSGQGVPTTRRARRSSGAVLRTGHVGTLDPLASGLLPLVTGSSTKLVDSLQVAPKTYKVGLLLGIQTETDDVAGQVVEETDAGRRRASEPRAIEDLLRTGRDRISLACSALVGDRTHRPPAYSAKRVNGVRLYELARALASHRPGAVDTPADVYESTSLHGIITRRSRRRRRVPVPDSEEELQEALQAGMAVAEKQIHVYESSLLDIDVEQRLITFRATVSAGTYARVLARELAADLGVLGTCASLERVEAAGEHLSAAVPIEIVEADLARCESVEEFVESAYYFRPFATLVQSLPHLLVSIRGAETRDRFLSGATTFVQPGNFVLENDLELPNFMETAENLKATTGFQDGRVLTTIVDRAEHPVFTGFVKIMPESALRSNVQMPPGSLVIKRSKEL